MKGWNYTLNLILDKMYRNKMYTKYAKSDIYSVCESQNAQIFSSSGCIPVSHESILEVWGKEIMN